jgi:hypothetical protein
MLRSTLGNSGLFAKNNVCFKVSFWILLSEWLVIVKNLRQWKIRVQCVIRNWIGLNLPKKWNSHRKSFFPTWTCIRAVIPYQNANTCRQMTPWQNELGQRLCLKVISSIKIFSSGCKFWSGKQIVRTSVSSIIPPYCGWIRNANPNQFVIWTSPTLLNLCFWGRHLYLINI